ncbi:MAG: GIY-YIG nuclease family protein [bacterium]|nr:GIY-YIG nuclease family protein [bacterium]
MKYQALTAKKLPREPGVYFFTGAGGKILYIGKATSIRERVRSYFGKDVANTRGPQIVSMIEKAKIIKFQKTDSVLEALILEAELIRKHRPLYNTKEKDDRSFNHIVITDEDFPRVLIIRARELQTKNYKLKTIFGPFPRGGILKDATKIIRKIFPFRDTCVPATTLMAQVGLPGIGRPCFNRQIGLCPGVCTGEISPEEYRARIKNLKLFLRGRKKDVVRNLTKEMRALSKRQEFEKAGEIKRTLFALTHIQDIALLKRHLSIQSEALDGFRIEAYDVAHISGKYLVGVMTVVEDGETAKDEYRKFKIKSFQGVDDTRALKEVLERRLAHPEWQYPKLIVVDGGKAQKNAAEVVLRAAGVSIPVVGVVKDEHHRPKEILGIAKVRPWGALRSDLEHSILLANSEAHRFAIKYHREVRGKMR